MSVQSLTAKRQVRNLGNLGRGDYFGDIALINGQARQATCITRSDTCLLTVGKEDFLELYKNRFSVRCVQAIKFLRKQVTLRSVPLRSAAFRSVPFRSVPRRAVPSSRD